MEEGGNIIRNVFGLSYKEAESITIDASKGDLNFISPEGVNFYGKDGGKKFGNYVVKEEEERIINVNGHFYNKDGTFEGKVNIAQNKGSVNDVYVCERKGNEKDTFVNAIKLDITHENFCYIAGVIKAEDASTFESAAATTQATFNAVKFEKGDGLSMEEQGKLAKKLLEISGNNAYSTVDKPKKIPLNDNQNDNYFKNTRKGLIHVLQGKNDYS